MSTGLKIVDVSSQQGNYIFGSNNEDGIIAKGTQGVNYVNPFCNFVLQQAIKQNAIFGVYHFADENSEPEEQARFFFKNCHDYFNSKNCIVILDYELNHTSGNIYNFINRFIDELKFQGNGHNVWVYGNNQVADALDFTYPFWYANYPYPTTAQSPATWQEPNFPKYIYKPSVYMWQYTTSNDQLDRSKFFGTVENWQHLSYYGNATK